MAASGKSRRVERRLVELGQIHAAKRDLGLDDENYRAFLYKVTGRRSAAELDEMGRGKLLAAFELHGWKPRRRKAKKAPPHGKRAQLAKVKALLTNMNKPDAYAEGIAKHMFNKPLVWLTEKELRAVIAALTRYSRRRTA